MGSLTRYSKLVIDHKLRQIAEEAVRTHCSPFKAIVEAAMVVDVPIDAVLSTVNESEWRKGLGAGATAYKNYMNSKYDQYLAAQKPATPPIPVPVAKPVGDTVEALTDTLKGIVQKLSDKHGLGDQQITQLFNQALRSLRTTDVGAGPEAGAYAQSYLTGNPGALFSTDTGNDADADAARELGLGRSDTFGTGDDADSDTDMSGQPLPSVEEMEKYIKPHMVGKAQMLKGAPGYERWLKSMYRHYKFMDRLNDPKSLIDYGASANKPKWYDKMTNAERAWFDNLQRTNPEAAEQFINRVNSVDSARLQPKTDDWEQAKIIADRTTKRNPWMKDKDATFGAAAGLWKRHKVRRDLAKLYGKGGDWEGEASPLDDFEDLLHKDHKKNIGNVLNEWCHLAGIKEKKPKKRGR